MKSDPIYDKESILILSELPLLIYDVKDKIKHVGNLFSVKYNNFPDIIIVCREKVIILELKYLRFINIESEGLSDFSTKLGGLYRTRENSYNMKSFSYIPMLLWNNLTKNPNFDIKNIKINVFEKKYENLIEYIIRNGNHKNQNVIEQTKGYKRLLLFQYQNRPDDFDFSNIIFNVVNNKENQNQTEMNKKEIIKEKDIQCVVMIGILNELYIEKVEELEKIFNEYNKIKVSFKIVNQQIKVELEQLYF